MLLKRKMSVGTICLEGSEFGGCYTYEVNGKRISIGKLNLEENQFEVISGAEKYFDAEMLFYIQELTGIFLETIFDDKERPHITFPAYYPNCAEERDIMSNFAKNFPCMSSFFDRIIFSCDNPYVEEMKKRFDTFYEGFRRALEKKAGISRNMKDKNALRSRVLESCYQTEHPSYHFQIHPNDRFLHMIMKNNNKEESC